MEHGATDLNLSKQNAFAASSAPFLHWPRWTPWVILLVAAFFRLAWLDVKPAHFDEGINGFFVDRMTRQGFYHYDPTNYHGPLHFYVQFVAQTLGGRNLWALRLPVVLAGLGTVWLAWGYRRFFGDRAGAIFAAGLAVSPGFVFYGRYAIHETWLVLFLMLLLWGVLELWRAGSRSGLAAVLIGVTGCVLTKETYLIHWIGLALAFAVWKAWGLVVKTSDTVPWAKPVWTRLDAIQLGTWSAFALVFFYSGNFFDWPGLKGLVTTFEAWMHTGLKTGDHVKTAQQWGPVNYYWFYLAWLYEPLMLAGVFLGVCSLGKLPSQVRFFALYGLACLCGYSLIDYKTPWCMVSLAWPFYLLAGVLLDRCWRGKTVWLVAGAGVVLFSFTIARSIHLNFFDYDDDREEYVYVQTSRELERLTGPIASLIKRDPAMLQIRGRVVLSSYHPLPWIFGDLRGVSYPKPGSFSENEDADFIVCSRQNASGFEARLKEAYYRVPFRLRSGMESCVVYFNAQIFEPEFDFREPDLPGRE